MSLFGLALLLRRCFRESTKQLSRIADSLEAISTAMSLPAPDTEVSFTDIGQFKRIRQQEQEERDREKISLEQM